MYIYLLVKKCSIFKEFPDFFLFIKALLNWGCQEEEKGHEPNQTLENWPAVGYYSYCLGPELLFFFYFLIWEHVVKDDREQSFLQRKALETM